MNAEHDFHRESWLFAASQAPVHTRSTQRVACLTISLEVANPSFSLMCAAVAVVAPTRAMLDTLAENYDSIFDGRVIHNGRQLLPLHAQWKQPFLLTTGRLWGEAKNIMVLEQVAKELPWLVAAAGDCEPKRTARFEISADSRARNWRGAWLRPARYELAGEAFKILIWS